MSSHQDKLNFTKAILNSLKLPPPVKRSLYHDSKTPGLGIRVTDTGHKSFVVYRKINGKPERITLGRYPDLSIEQARHKTIEINAAIVKGENPNDKRRTERAEITLGGLFQEYMERYAKLHKKSWKDDEARFRLHLSHWTDKRLSQITEIDIEKLHIDVGKNHEVEANRLISLLSIMFKKAIKFGLWSKSKPNPASGIEKFRRNSLLQGHTSFLIIF